MAKKHIQSVGKTRAICGAETTRFVQRNEDATCNGCRSRADLPARQSSGEPNWSRKCVVCGSSPVLDVTGMCGPCTFGEADTAGGDW